MGLFSRSTEIASPCTGTMKALSEVNDPVFAQGMVGCGFAVVPTEKTITSPIDGEVTMVFPGGHAFGMKDKKDREYLVHMGLDTVKLKGEGFETNVEVGQKLRRGDVVSHMDIDLMHTRGFECDVLVLVTSPVKLTMKAEFSQVDQGKIVAEVKDA